MEQAIFFEVYDMRDQIESDARSTSVTNEGQAYAGFFAEYLQDNMGRHSPVTPARNDAGNMPQDRVPATIQTPQPNTPTERSTVERPPQLTSAEAAALVRRGLEPCHPLFAYDAAKALDTDNLAEAKRLLNECGLANPDFFQDLKAFQDFSQRVSSLENKNEGLNLNLKWELGAGDVYNLTGMEIGEANW